MDSSFLLTIVVVAAIVLFTLLRKLIFLQDTKEKVSSSSLTHSSVPPSSSSRTWTHHVFPSFRGEDVRRDFLSHILAEFQRKAITPFIDNEIRRGESIGPELILAIRESKIAVILLSRNYASSKWCLDELVEIMNCREELGQTVVAIFYRVDPSDVKKLTGDFGKVFRKTCAGKPKEDIGRWKQALEKVATVAGYHSSNWDDEAAMIKKIAIDISNKLNCSISSRDFDGLVGMRAHFENMEPLLCLDSNEVRMIGIWGPPGIGKTTIARVVYNQLSNCFQQSVFIEKIEANYASPCSDDYTTQLELQQQFLSQITNHKDMEVSHLGVVRDRLKDKKVLVVLDGVDHMVQLDAMAKETWWFGPGSRILITAQDQKLFKAHGIKNIYKVDFPSSGEALQIFCMSAFRQKFPEDGFEELAWKVTERVGELPLGLRVMGSYFRGMSKQDWTESLPGLESSLTHIQSILKLSYDALDDKNKELFLYIACFFNYYETKRVEEHLGKEFVDVRLRLRSLADKSLISFGGPNGLYISMHSLLVKLGREIVRKQHIRDPGQRQFLVGERDICEVLTSDAAGSKSVVGIDSNNFFDPIHELDMSERAFEGMSNLQFLRLQRNHMKLPRGLKYISRKLKLLEWRDFPMTYLPSIVNVECLVELIMPYSKLEKLWDGIKRLPNLKCMDLEYSKNLKEIPDLSTATNLEILSLRSCSSLVELPPSIGNATNLKKLDLNRCSSLMELPLFIGNAINLEELSLRGCSNLVDLPLSIGKVTNLQKLDLHYCSSLVELPLSIGNLQKLKMLSAKGCSKLEILPTNINLTSLDVLDLTDCSMLKSFPEISTNIRVLNLIGTAIEEVPLSIGLLSHLDRFEISYIENLKEFPHALDIITELDLSNREIQEVPPCVKRMPRLNKLYLKGCTKLVSLQQIPDSVSEINAEGCSSLVELPRSIENLQELETLILKGCTKLEVLPTNINLMRSLNVLDLTDCLMLKTFPEISTNITKLKLNRTAIEEVPPSINSWSGLRDLCMSECINLKGFSQTFESITEMYVSDTEREEVPPFSNLQKVSPLQNLQDMDLSWCRNLKELPDFSAAINLQSLDLSGCSNLQELPSTIGNAINLWILDLSGCSNLQELPSTIGDAINLEILDLSGCSNLRELPSTIGDAINLQILNLSGCSNLLELPSTIGNAINLRSLDLSGCSNLQELPSTIGNATDLEKLDLRYCSNLVELPLSIGNLQKLEMLNLIGCSKLEILPTNINLKSLDKLDLTNCLMLESFPEISTNIQVLKLQGTAIEEVPLSIGSWSHLDFLEMSYFENLKEFPHALDIITGLELSDREIQEVPPCVKRMSRLIWFSIMGCRKLVSLPQFPDSLSWIDAEGCESLERLDCSFPNPLSCLYFAKCFNLNQEARDLIIHSRTSSSDVFSDSYSYSVLPGREVPLWFTHRATCGDCSVTIKLNEGSLSKSMRFKACFWLVYKGDDDTDWKAQGSLSVTCENEVCFEAEVLREHLYTFEVEAEVTSSEAVFEFEVKDKYLWEIGECGLLELS